ncbi:MAG: SIS domain-containing protein, partial [Candidatus Riflebacteria bacterium]|nr:SIS domain-containing protein [Candidatus Riflebacteria bacterium]
MTAAIRRDEAIERVSAYLGLRPRHEDLLGCWSRLDQEKLAAMARTLGQARRVVVIGNGGSLDNARLVARFLGGAGLRTVALEGLEEIHDAAVEEGFDRAFARALGRLDPGPGDVLLALSGSGSSPNVLEALATMREAGGAMLGLTGGDGGAMLGLLGEERTIVAPSAVMETIEDLHCLAGLALAAALSGDPGIERGQIGQVLEQDLGRQVDFLADLTTAISATLAERRRVFILGVSPMACHFRQDLERGATNTVPIVGFRAPDLVGADSLTAAANDDGFASVYLRPLVKLSPSPGDVAVLIGEGGATDTARALLSECGCPTFLVRAGGGSGRSLAIPRPRPLFEVAVGVVDHAISRTLNDWLVGLLDVKPLELPSRAWGEQRRRPDRRQ